MDQPSRPASCAVPDPQSAHSALEYVSVTIDGSTYGGWYRLLSDGRMELLALANMRSEPRSESPPGEQAKCMLTDLIRSIRPQQNIERNPGLGSNASADARRQQSQPTTLGDLLYAGEPKARVSEKDWEGLVQSTAAGDLLALHRLFERTDRIVFTLLLRLTQDSEIAEELSAEVFLDLWRLAGAFQPHDESVLGWIMNLARSRALNELQFGRHQQATQGPRPSDSIVSWPPDVLSPPATLWARIAARIAAETGRQLSARPASTWQQMEPNWEQVGPGITCKLLATDTQNDRVSMLVRLEPGAEYPPHTHAGVEELHLLAGELLIDDTTLFPGDYNRAEQGTADKRVFSETGCMCVLVTSTRDTIS